MKVQTVTSTRKSIYFAHKFEPDRNPEGRKDAVLWGFYPSLFVCRLTSGKDRTYYKVEITPFEGPAEDAPYWAWWNNEEQKFHHVYYFKGMVQMCFPYDLAIYEEKGEGKRTPVIATIIETYEPGEDA